MAQKRPLSPYVILSDAQWRTLTEYEIETAEILAEYFKREVVFVPAINSYRLKTADIEMNGRAWELKNPEGNSRKNTIKRQLKRGKRQSRSIAVTTFATSLSDTFVRDELLAIVKEKRVRLEGLIMIGKNKEVFILK